MPKWIIRAKLVLIGGDRKVTMLRLAGGSKTDPSYIIQCRAFARRWVIVNKGRLLVSALNPTYECKGLEG